jgi:hypothetical protein
MTDIYTSGGAENLRRDTGNRHSIATLRVLLGFS